MIWMNDIESYVVQWGRNLIQAKHLPPGTYDPRPIQEIRPHELNGYDQCHFFAGIGGWALAFRLAGWEGPAWTGSCPCQPFSVAGKRGGTDDPRHLWPNWFKLIEKCRPPVIFGEQVASKDGYAWLDIVQADLEGAGYTFGAVISPAAGYGAPHIRHRIYFVADAERNGRRGRSDGYTPGEAGQTQPQDQTEGPGTVGGAAYNSGPRLERRTQQSTREEQPPAQRSRDVVWMADAPNGDNGARQTRTGWPGLKNNGTAGFWSACDWIPCTDGKARPVEPGTFPLAHGVPKRMGRLRAYGNAIVVPQAVEFVRAYMDGDGA